MIDVVTAMARTLSHFADATHPALTVPPLRGKQIADTGVTAHYRADKPNLVKFAFIVTLNKGAHWENSKQVGIEFDMDKLQLYGEEYVKGTLVQVTKAIEMFAEADRKNETGVLTLH